MSGHRCQLAAQLGGRDPLLCLPSGSQEDYLHHKRHREPERLDPQGCAQQGALSLRSGGHQAALAALRNITENWKRPPIAWQAAKAQLAIQFGKRFIFDVECRTRYEVAVGQPPKWYIQKQNAGAARARVAAQPLLR
jgi:hypothetical protein